MSIAVKNQEKIIRNVTKNSDEHTRIEVNHEELLLRPRY
jgi:hypothetical protein